MTLDVTSYPFVQYIMDAQSHKNAIKSTAGIPWSEEEHMAFLNGLQAFGKVCPCLHEANPIVFPMRVDSSWNSLIYV